MGSNPSRAAKRRAQSASTQSAIKSAPIETAGSEVEPAKPRRVVRKTSDVNVTPPPVSKPVDISRTSLMLDIEGLDRKDRPWSLAQGEGAKVLADNATTFNGAQTVVIEMDAGAFRWMWECAEANGLKQWRKYHGVTGTQVIADAAVRAILAMRKAGKTNWPNHYSAPTKKRIVRKASAKASSKGKRVVRRKK